ncbi:hypothetical protein KKI34_14325 [Pseudoalteromonas tetraodonis]|nr:hypothetical protein [Pseudoalteromonas tetraodonis]MBT2152919.1 hypothetical protein [Pseudoalteromonas tetraodonis]
MSTTTNELVLRVKSIDRYSVVFMRKSPNVTYVKYQCLYMMAVFNGLTQ